MTRQQANQIWESLHRSKIRLSSDLHFYPRVERGCRWWVIESPGRGEQFRINETTHRLLVSFDGQKTLEQSYQETEGTFPDKPPRELCQLLAELIRHRLIEVEGASLSSSPRLVKPLALRVLANPFCFKLISFDPRPYLGWQQRCCSLLFSRYSLWITVLILIWGGWVCISHWPELIEYSRARLDDPLNLLWLWGLYPFLKLFHELAHVMALRRWGERYPKPGCYCLSLCRSPM
ncbi:hypothetical protein [Dongshaea marina]|uniref:hypothetical protein n=1 Tax=Dongshaea marina TaxID=2047966 RepID=UPI000D3E8220|nr:hypothetical protein [Dongshaea marina]